MQFLSLTILLDEHILAVTYIVCNLLSIWIARMSFIGPIEADFIFISW